MTIEREINGVTLRIELTNDEVYDAHKEFVTSWMTDTVMEIIELYHEDVFKKLAEKDYESIAETAYEIYSDGDGYTEYEAVEEAVEEFIENMEDNVALNIEDFLERFNEIYEYLYEENDKVEGFDIAVSTFDNFQKTHTELVREFDSYRGDLISSDREAATFIYALNEMLEGM